MSLKNKLAELVKSMTDRAAARERWLSLQEAKSDEQYEARRAHLALDDLVETNYESLSRTLVASQSGGVIEFDVMTLGLEEVSALRRVLSERGLLGLLEPARPNTLPELVGAWRQAAYTLEAARALDRIRMTVVADELPSAIEAFDGKIRTTQPEAWLRAVATYQALRANLADGLKNRSDHQCEQLEDAEAVDADWLNGEATHQNARRWLKRYDDLTELLQTLVERLSESNALSFELEELDVPARKALISAIDGGLCRQRQLAPQPQTRRQLETMTETETETETNGDLE